MANHHTVEYKYGGFPVFKNKKHHGDEKMFCGIDWCLMII